MMFDAVLCPLVPELLRPRRHPRAMYHSQAHPVCFDRTRPGVCVRPQASPVIRLLPRQWFRQRT